MEGLRIQGYLNPRHMLALQIANQIGGPKLPESIICRPGGKRSIPRSNGYGKRVAPRKSPRTITSRYWTWPRRF
jgi:hypothetical protein